jgi:hypothetical protein
MMRGNLSNGAAPLDLGSLREASGKQKAASIFALRLPGFEK